jgi:hypothetical protein
MLRCIGMIVVIMMRKSGRRVLVYIIIIIKSIPGRVEELRILIVNGVSTPVKDLPALQLRYLIIRHVSLLPAVINLLYHSPPVICRRKTGATLLLVQLLYILLIHTAGTMHSAVVR